MNTTGTAGCRAPRGRCCRTRRRRAAAARHAGARELTSSIFIGAKAPGTAADAATAWATRSSNRRRRESDDVVTDDVSFEAEPAPVVRFAALKIDRHPGSSVRAVSCRTPVIERPRQHVGPVPGPDRPPHVADELRLERGRVTRSRAGDDDRRPPQPRNSSRSCAHLVATIPFAPSHRRPTIVSQVVQQSRVGEVPDDTEPGERRPEAAARQRHPDRRVVGGGGPDAARRRTVRSGSHDVRAPVIRAVTLVVGAVGHDRSCRGSSSISFGSHVRGRTASKSARA